MRRSSEGRVSICELDNCLNLLSVQTVVQVRDVIDACAGLEILEDHGYRYPGPFRNPCATNLAWNAFDCEALRPIEFFLRSFPRGRLWEAMCFFACVFKNVIDRSARLRISDSSVESPT